MRPLRLSLILVALTAFEAFGRQSFSQSPLPGIHTEGVPPMPPGLADGLMRYGFVGTGDNEFQGWLAGKRQVLYIGRDAKTRQVFLGTGRGSARTLTALPGSVKSAAANPVREQFVFAVDNGGNESYRLFLQDVATGVSRPLTSERCASGSPQWSRDGRFLAFTSNARNGKDHDL